eukprot:COSAG04_NODE_2054_length_4901_cov_1.544565_6_plen_65_part_01
MRLTTRLTVLSRHETLQQGVEPVPHDAGNGEAQERHQGLQQRQLAAQQRAARLSSARCEFLQSDI